MHKYVCEFDGREIAVIEANSEEEAYDKMMDQYSDLNYGLYDGVVEIYEMDWYESKTENIS